MKLLFRNLLDTQGQGRKELKVKLQFECQSGHCQRALSQVLVLDRQQVLFVHFQKIGHSRAESLYVDTNDGLVIVIDYVGIGLVLINESLLILLFAESDLKREFGVNTAIFFEEKLDLFIQGTELHKRVELINLCLTQEGKVRVDLELDWFLFSAEGVYIVQGLHSLHKDRAGVPQQGK